MAIFNEESPRKKKNSAIVEYVTKKRNKKPKTHRGYGDLFAVKRFDIKLNLL